MTRVGIFAFIFLIATLSLIANEPSVFSVKALEDRDPYGLTQTEQHILRNKKSLNRISKKIDQMKIDTKNLQNITTDTFASFRKDIILNTTKIQDTEALIKVLEMSYENLKVQTSQLDSKISYNLESMQELKKILKSLVDTIKKINNSYASKDYLDDAINKLVDAKIKKMLKNNPSLLLEQMTGYELLTKAKKLFSERKYSKSKNIFLMLLDRKYKSATSNYYLGEISFFTKEYKNALNFYKTSVTLYKKASYIPTLLLHSAISSGIIGNNDDARKFLKSIVLTFPESKEAVKAQKLLDKNKT